MRLFRKSLGLTQESLAKALGVGRTTYTNIECGATKPTELFLNCLCATYGLDKAELLDTSIETVPSYHGHIVTLLEQKYNELDDRYKIFILKQIDDLLELQENS